MQERNGTETLACSHPIINSSLKYWFQSKQWWFSSSKVLACLSLQTLHISQEWYGVSDKLIWFLKMTSQKGQ